LADLDSICSSYSVYDDFRWMDLFGDPGFVVHKSMAQMWGLLAINIADSAVLPLNYTAYAAEVAEYIDETDALFKQAGVPPSVTTAPLRAAQAAFAAAATRIAAEAARTPAALLPALNDRLVQAERGLLAAGGLAGPAEAPTRAWYRHTVYAPAAHNDYASTRFPGILDAVQWAALAPSAERWEAVSHQVWEVARAVERAARALDGVLV
jgi:N-acetylated-alpha-linked acidic dipeptidase